MMRTRDPLTNTDATAWNTEAYDGTEEAVTAESMTPAERLENSQILSMLIGILGLVFIVYHFVQTGLI